MLVKIYGASSDSAKGRYSPAERIWRNQASGRRQSGPEAYHLSSYMLLT